MKRLTYLMVLLFAATTLSCNRDGFDETFKQATPWEFHVQVFSDDNRTQKIEGVTVTLYRANKSGDVGPATLMYTKTTNASGKAIFTKAEFQASGWPLSIATDDPAGKGKGVYFISVSKTGYKSITSATEYLLLNDGWTHQFVVLKTI